MEKRRPHHDLAAVKTAFVSSATLRITKTALRCAEELGITIAEIVEVVQAMTRGHFVKSMTSNMSSTVWQDVYEVPFQEFLLYVKLTTDSEGYLVISFKEK